MLGLDWRGWIRLLSIGLILVALLSYLRGLDVRRQPVPLAPLTVPAGFAPRPALPLAAGALRGQNLVHVTLDTTRPDRLGVHGNAEIATPHLDRLASEGVVFTRATATAPTTLPGHASILTGLYPIHHGARSNGHHRVRADAVTLAEVLSSHGYRTAAFVSAFVLDERYGLARGFDLYDAETNRSSGYLGPSERRADHTTDRAVAWLEQGQPEPFFLWVHYYDPHAGHEPPPPFDDAYAALPYDGEIAFVDDQIGRLLEAVRASNDHGEVVVVTADHAEAFGEHGEWSHGFLVQEATLRIPLILYASRGLPRGVHVTSRASQVDLVPTLLAGLGIPVPPGLDGADLARPPQGDRAVLAEAAEGRARYGWARLGVIYRGPLKYVAGPIPELYDLAEDPLERDNVVAQRAGEAKRLARQLASLEAGGGDVLDPGGVALDPDDLQRLQALGYALGAGTEPAPARADAPDPKQMMPVMVRIQSLVTDFGIDPELPLWRRLAAWLNGRPFIASRADLIRAFEELAAEHPDYGPAWDYLAGLYREEGRLEDAGEAQRRADAAR